MRSPFPGLDPYLEQHWGDVHQRLAIYSSNALQRQLPAGLRARTDERVYVEREDEEPRLLVPDVAISQRPDWRGGAGWRPEEEGGVAVAKPVAVAVQEPTREGFVEIREKSGGKLITVIEFLSPANKLPGTGRALYKRKQFDLEQADVNLVEIDLVRAGQRVFEFPSPPSAMRSRDPMACVRQGTTFSLYVFPLREKLPALRIPLRWDDSPALLDLQALQDQCYLDGAYDDIDYQAEPQPPLHPEDAAWADAILRSAGRR